MKVVPRLMWITLNHKCNFRCRWCYNKHTKYVGEDMPIELVKDLISLAKELELPAVYFIGGEPTLYPHLFEMNDHSRSVGMDTVIVTNGERFSDDAFWDEYQKYPNDTIGISIKSGNTKQHKLVTGTPLFENVRKAITRAVASKVRCDVSFVHSIFSVNNFLEVIRMIKSCGVKYILVSFCGPTFDKDTVSSRYMIPLKTLAEKMMKEYNEASLIMEGGIGYATEIPLCIFPLEFVEKMLRDKSFSNTCQLTEGVGTIFTPDGSLAVCNHLTAYPIGKFGVDFKTADELIRFQNSEKIRRYYNSLRCYPSARCKECTLWDVCVGGCPLNWAVYNPEEVIQPFTREVHLGDVPEAVENVG